MTTARLLDHWSSPEGAGLAVACLATSFTFDGDFFTEDCLSRFPLPLVRAERGRWRTRRLPRCWKRRSG